MIRRDRGQHLGGRIPSPASWLLSRRGELLRHFTGAWQRANLALVNPKPLTCAERGSPVTPYDYRRYCVSGVCLATPHHLAKSGNPASILLRYNMENTNAQTAQEVREIAEASAKREAAAGQSQGKDDLER